MRIYLSGIVIGVVVACVFSGFATPLIAASTQHDLKGVIVSLDDGQRWKRVDDFQSGLTGEFGAPADWKVGNVKSTLTETLVDPVRSGNRALRISRLPKGGGGPDSVFHSGYVNLPSGGTGTVFLRFMVEAPGEGNEYNIPLGTGPGSVRAGVFIRGKDQVTIQAMGNGPAQPLKVGSWYRLWIVTENKIGQTAGGKVLLQGEDEAEPRSLGKSMSAQALDFGTFSVIGALSHLPATLWLDDVYVDNTGENLGSPVEQANALAAPAPRSVVVSRTMRADGDVGITTSAMSVDALGPTGWFQGMWPTDASMPTPMFPRFVIEPESQAKPGVSITKQFPMDRHLDACLPKVTLALVDAEGREAPLYSGGADSQIAYRFGNLLKVIDAAGPVKRSVEMAIISHQSVVMRVRLDGGGTWKLTARAELSGGVPSQPGSGRALLPSPRGWHGLDMLAGKLAGEAMVVVAYDAASRERAEAALAEAGKLAENFDALWQKLSRPQAIEPFLTGKETPLERNLVAAFVNRVLRNQRQCGLIREPSSLEFFGPEWSAAAATWICFQPASRYNLWIEPAFWANSIRTLLDQQAADGRVPQAVYPGHAMGNSQIPNITPCARDYYVFTKDRTFLEYVYPRFKKWYGWWIEKRNESGDGIIAVGSSKIDVMSSVFEYKDNQPIGHGGHMPLTRVPGVDGRPERVYLPDIVACQARMAEDLAFMARELGDKDGEAYFSAEYRRVKEWANQNLWDEGTQFYYPVVRATGQKIMKRSNTVFWLLWAGIPDARKKDALVKAMLDPHQFFTTIPLPQIALSDPSFDTKVHHWGDGYVWPIDVLHAFDGLLRYGEWAKAAQLAGQFNRGVFGAIKDSRQPYEFYHHSGKPEGCSLMGTAGCLPLVFQRYLKDYQANEAQAQWLRFGPPPRAIE